MYAKAISMLFYMFFTCIVFNPQISGVTIYLYVMLPMLDPGFISYLLATFRRWAIPLGISIVICLLSSPMAAAKVISVAICLGYLAYTFSRRIDYLNLWMAINILFGVLQFIAYYVDYDLSVQLGPNAVSQMLWGASATQTNTNFYEIMFFARVCGFSREAGFFASLLVASFVLYLMQDRPKSKLMIALYCLGLVISFSKASLVLVIFVMLYYVRRPLRSIHPLVSIFVFTAISMALALYMSQHDFFGSATFAHRFAGYPFMLDARFSDLIKGIGPGQLNSDYDYLPYVHMNADLYAESDVTFSSLPGLVSDMGLIAALALVGVLAFTASDGFVVLLFLLITATVSVTMVTSFVPIAYLICYWPRISAYNAEQRRRPHVPAGRGSSALRPT
ncbi:hypothetical protein [Paraburkholderia sp. DHOC27]|uniref:hypothetical protein n=1 Tax=Paraburkholderia sp. DHOC27 TaxID=2303330 RepID=UPI000E3CC5A1|nr:hypothetical protein [Paraburkholderia sp. DHOC27]RFU46020.1 hypothetical protein D0B32_20420 [Paraburkholderia sp. DHOC27]